MALPLIPVLSLLAIGGTISGTVVVNNVIEEQAKSLETTQSVVEEVAIKNAPLTSETVITPVETAIQAPTPISQTKTVVEPNAKPKTITSQPVIQPVVVEVPTIAAPISVPAPTTHATTGASAVASEKDDDDEENENYEEHEKEEEND